MQGNNNRNPNQGNRSEQQAQPQPMGRPMGGGMQGPMVIEKPKNSKKTLVRLVKYLSKNIPLLILILSFNIINTIITIVATRINGSIIDNFIVKKDISGLFVICGILLGIYLVNVVFIYFQERFTAKLSQSTTALLRKNLFFRYRQTASAIL